MRLKGKERKIEQERKREEFSKHEHYWKPIGFLTTKTNEVYDINECILCGYREKVLNPQVVSLDIIKPPSNSQN